MSGELGSLKVGQVQAKVMLVRLIQFINSIMLWYFHIIQYFVLKLMMTSTLVKKIDLGSGST